MNRVLVVLLVVLAASCSEQSAPTPTAVSQEDAIAVREFSAGAEVENGTCAEYDLAGQRQMTCILVTAVPTATLTIEPTGTAVPATPTLARATRTPPATATIGIPTQPPITITPPVTVTPGSFPPVANAPSCESVGIEHVPTEFHSLWNTEYGCYWKHSHHMEYPDWAFDIWGDYTQYTGGQEISYPWQTVTATGCLELDCKGNGYKLHAVNLSEFGCQPQFDNDNGVLAFFSESHNLANEHDFNVPIHSAFAMLQICDPNDPDNLGTMVVGFHPNYAQPVSPYQGDLVYMLSNPQPPYDTKVPPYRTIDCQGGNGCRSLAVGHTTWDSDSHTDSVLGNSLVALAFRQRDYMIYILDADRASEEGHSFLFFCGGEMYMPEGCFQNGTTFGVYKWRVSIPLEWDGLEDFDTDGDGDNGRVTFSGWVRPLSGELAPDCTEASLQCAPLILDNAPVGNASLNMERLHGLPVFGAEVLPETDFCFLDGVAVPEGTPGCEWSGWVETSDN